MNNERRYLHFLLPMQRNIILLDYRRSREHNSALLHIECTFFKNNNLNRCLFSYIWLFSLDFILCVFFVFTVFTAQRYASAVCAVVLFPSVCIVSKESNWQDFNWHNASRSSCVIAELLVISCFCTCLYPMCACDMHLIKGSLLTYLLYYPVSNITQRIWTDVYPSLSWW